MGAPTEARLPVVGAMALVVVERVLDAAAQVRERFPVDGVLELLDIGDVITCLNIHVVLGPWYGLDLALPDNADEGFHHLLETRPGATTDVEDFTAAGWRDGGEQ